MPARVGDRCEGHEPVFRAVHDCDACAAEAVVVGLRAGAPFPHGQRDARVGARGAVGDDERIWVATVDWGEVIPSAPDAI